MSSAWVFVSAKSLIGSDLASPRHLPESQLLRAPACRPTGTVAYPDEQTGRGQLSASFCLLAEESDSINQRRVMTIR